MGFTVLTGVRLFAVGADLTGASNKIELSGEYEEKDVTVMTSNGWKEIQAGLGSAEATAEGFWQAGDPTFVDDASWSQIGGAGPWSIGPVGANVGDLAYFMNALRSSYNFMGAVGDVAPYKGAAKSTWPLVRGKFAHPPGTARTSSGTGTGIQLGAVPAGSRLYSAVHVLSAAGTTPSVTVTIESSVDNVFTTPATRLTHTAANAVSGEILRTSGTAVTDSWYRAKWAITGTAPSFLFAVAFGIE